MSLRTGLRRIRTPCTERGAGLTGRPISWAVRIAEKNLYLHIRDPHIQHVELTLPEACRVKSATVLDTGARVEVRQRGDGRISLVCSFPEDAQIPVIALKLNRKIRFDGWLESTAS